MPTVPKAPIGQISVGQLPGPRQTGVGADAFGANLANALTSTGNAMGNIALEQKVADDEAAVKALDVEFNRTMRDMLYNSDDAYYNKKGKTALDLRDKVMTGIDEMRLKFLDRATNQAQRDMLGRTLSSRTESAFNNISSYAMREREVYFNGLADARIADAIEDSAANYTDKKLMAQNMRVIEDEVGQLQERNGWSPEEAAQTLEKQRTTLHVAVIDRMAVHNPMAAQAYYKKNRDQIDGRVQGDIEKSLESSTLDQQALYAFSAIQAGGGTLEEQLAASDKYKHNVKLYDEVRGRIKMAYSEQQTIKEANDRALVEAASDRITTTPTMAMLDTLTNDERNALGPSGIKSLETFVAQRAQGQPIATHLDNYFTLKIMALEDPKTFATVPLKLYANSIEKTDLDHLIALKSSVIGSMAGKKPSRVYDNTRSVKEIVNSSLKIKSIEVGDKATAEETRLGNMLWRFVEDQVSIQNILDDDPQWRQKVQGIVDGAFLKNGFWGKYLFEQTSMDTETTKEYAESIPPEDRTKIIARMSEAGIKEPKEWQILKTWLTMKGIRYGNE